MTTETADLKVSMEKPGAWARRLTITVPAARIELEKKTAAQRIAKQARLPGFRKGKVPVQVMEKRFGAAIEQEAVEKAIGAAYREALTQQGLQPITQGNIDNIDYEAGRDLTFNVELEVRPEIELERIGGFQLLRELAPVADAQVTEVVDRLRQEHAAWRAKAEHAPTAGDRVKVQITPLDDATGATPAQAREYQIVIGEGQAIPAIEDVLRTLRAGEEGEFTVEIPDPNDAAAGTRPHHMHVRMIEVEEPLLPELDDEFARSLGDFESLDQLRERIRADLGREAERESERRLRAELLTQVIAANPFDVPDAMVSQYLEAMLPARPGNAEDPRMADLRREARPAAEEALKRILVIERVAELEGLHAQPGELEARVEEIADRLGRPAPEVTAQLRKNGRLDELEREITEEKVFGYLKSLSTIS